jgi:hypothetical protein
MNVFFDDFHSRGLTLLFHLRLLRSPVHWTKTLSGQPKLGKMLTEEFLSCVSLGALLWVLP